MSADLLDLFAAWGLPVLFFGLMAGQAGAPLPTSILLMTAGALVTSGDLALANVFAAAVAGAVMGDQIGYLLGRALGAGMLTNETLARRLGPGLQKAQAFSQRWGSMGIFLSRWLVSQIGPLVNYATGAARFSWPTFLFWDVAGEALWVAIFVGIGMIFAESIGGLADAFANFGWFIGALAASLFLGWRIWKVAGKSSTRP